jgi:5-methyltetrahydropteroyltriglutamate--homocysteine methyltransferase
MRIATTHTGSLVRPDELIGFLRAREDGRPYDEPAFEGALEQAVTEVVAHQVQVGLDAVDDGEFPKPGSWAKYVHRAGA